MCQHNQPSVATLLQFETRFSSNGNPCFYCLVGSVPALSFPSMTYQDPVGDSGVCILGLLPSATRPALNPHTVGANKKFSFHLSLMIL